MLAENIRFDLLAEINSVIKKIISNKPLMLIRFAALNKSIISKVTTFSAEQCEITFNTKLSMQRREWLHFARHETVHFLRNCYTKKLNRWVDKQDIKKIERTYNQTTKIWNKCYDYLKKAYKDEDKIHEELIVEVIAKLIK